MYFGNDIQTVKRLAVIGSILGLLVVLVALIGVAIEGGWDDADLWVLVPLFLVGPVLLVMVVIPSTFFGIRLTSGTVQHVFLKRYVLTEYPIRDVERVELLARVLAFRGGGQIRLWAGMHGRTFAALEQAIHVRKAQLDARSRIDGQPRGVAPG
jgi:hypothetical protein